MGPQWAQVDGRRALSLPLTDRGLAFGDGLFETIRLQEGTAPLWAGHRARLSAGCERLRIAYPAARVEAALAEAIAHRPTGVARLKLMVTRGSGGRGWQPPAASTPVVAAALWEGVPHAHPVELISLSHRLPHNPPLAGLKSLGGLDYVVAALELSESAPSQDGLLLCARGTVIETLRHNLFAVIDGRLYTPDLRGCGVAGVARQWLLDQAGFTPQVEPITLSRLLKAEEVFVTNALIGAAPVCAIDTCTMRFPGPLTQAVQSAFTKLFAGTVR